MPGLYLTLSPTADPAIAGPVSWIDAVLGGASAQPARKKFYSLFRAGWVLRRDEAAGSVTIAFRIREKDMLP